MSSLEWAASALQAFDGVVQASQGFRSRAGQRRMAEQVARTLASATLGKARSEGEDDGPADPPVRAIAVIQAGTGVGKSLAYCAPAIALALARNTRVVISTATVALQEQLVHKDLPALAKLLPEPFRFALAKGRGRYVCVQKLERLTGVAVEVVDAEPGDDSYGDLFANDDAHEPHESASRPARPAHEVEARLQFYTGVAKTLASGAWDGDRDSLDTPLVAEAWLPMAAEAASCTGKHCPSFNECVYYERRKTLVGAQVIVVNHDLLLATLGNRQLPELDNCLLVLDEAHHLPATALAQFACRMDLGRHGWVERLAQRAVRVGVRFEVTEVADIPTHASQMRQALQETERLVLDLYGDALQADPNAAPGRGPARVRLPLGVLPEALQGPLGRVAHHAEGFLEALRVIATALRAELRDQPAMARKLSAVYAQLGALAPRLEQTLDTARLLLRDAPADAVPTAKWFTLDVDGDQATLQAHASPLLPGATLRHQLWSKVRGAVLTSATLTSCGSFDFFLRESGLQGDAAATTLEVPSPFDYAAQGRLIAVETRADPRDADYIAQMVQLLMRDLADVRHGALVLFTSREQLRLALEALPPALRPRVLAQTAMPRQQLMATHRHRVAEGLPSIIFGMQSFGEGLDLPGSLCEAVFIAKLPFAPPDDPVGEARAEWLRTVGRDPFSELVVPATAMRLAQWVGRAIRSEDDRASVYCYDRRLVRTSYGQRLLKGLPPFALTTLKSPVPRSVAAAGFDAPPGSGLVPATTLT